MKRWLIALSALLLLAAGALHGPAGVIGASTTPDDAATVSALQTQVAKDSTKIASLTKKVYALRTQVAELKGELPTPTPEPAKSGVGATQRVDGWDITPVSTDERASTGSDSLYKAARGVYLVVYLTLVNTSDAPAAFPYDDLVAKDGRGRSFSPDSDAVFNVIYDEFGLSRSEDIEPGVSYNTAVVFDVATDASGFSLTTGSNVFSVALDR